MFSLESPHRGDSNECTQYTIFNIEKKITLNYRKSAAMGFCAKGLKNEFETAVVNEPSVLEPLKFYCTHVIYQEISYWPRYGSQVYCLCLRPKPKGQYSSLGTWGSIQQFKDLRTCN